jgi:hypothetical protein
VRADVSAGGHGHSGRAPWREHDQRDWRPRGRLRACTQPVRAGASAIDELIPARVRGRVDLIINGSYWVGPCLHRSADRHRPRPRGPGDSRSPEQRRPDRTAAASRAGCTPAYGGRAGSPPHCVRPSPRARSTAPARACTRSRRVRRAPQTGRRPPTRPSTATQPRSGREPVRGNQRGWWRSPAPGERARFASHARAPRLGRARPIPGRRIGGMAYAAEQN